MLHFVHGDIFKSQAQVITNPVNCVGVMGKGLALAFKNAYPRSFDEYRKLCTAGVLRPGVPCLSSADTRLILLFPTKDHWRNPSKTEYIEDGLKFLAEHYQKLGIESLALPKLGAGLGGLPWAIVRSLIVKHLGSLPINIEVYE
mgnify:FL=1